MLAFLSVCLTSTPALASENGSIGSYGIGVQTIAVGVLPPPGATLLSWYAVYYTADTFRDDKGHASIPDFGADLSVQALRVAHSWASYKGVTLTSAVSLESINAQIKVAGQKDSDFGPTLYGIEPLRFGVKLGDWYLQTGPYVWLPLGSYNKQALANSTLGYRTISQTVSATWLPTPQWELSLDTNVSFNSRNKDTGYHSGDLLGLTYSLGYRPFVTRPQWQIGINGFYARQLSDDDIDGRKVPTGFRLRKFAVGPQVVYWVSQAVAVAFKAQHEMGARNAPEGDSIWALGAFPLPF